MNWIITRLLDQLLRNTAPPLPSIGQVKSCLKHLSPRKATGVDRIPAWILKRFCDDLGVASIYKSYNITLSLLNY